MSTAEAIASLDDDIDLVDQIPGRPVVPDDLCDASARTYRWGNPLCGHDYPREPSVKHWAYREWTCTRCGRVTRLETV